MMQVRPDEARTNDGRGQAPSSDQVRPEVQVPVVVHHGADSPHSSSLQVRKYSSGFREYAPHTVLMQTSESCPREEDRSRAPSAPEDSSTRLGDGVAVDGQPASDELHEVAPQVL